MKTPPMAEASRRFGKDIDLARLRRTISWRREIAGHQQNLAEQLLPHTTRISDCPICKAGSTELIATIYGFIYRACPGCGHIFCATPPQAEAIRNLYHTERDATPSAQRVIYVDPQLFAARVDMIGTPKVRHISSFVPKGKWIDIGCGTGEILFAAKGLGWNVRGVESDAAEADFARSQGIEILEEFIDQENAGRIVADADVVSLINILEHTIDPTALLQAIAAPLQAGAKVVMEVPRHPSLSSLCSVCFPELAARHIYPPDHLHIFTERSLQLMLSAANLQAVNIWLFGQDFHEVLTCLDSHGKHLGSSWIPELHESINVVQQTLDKQGLSDTMLVIAQKSTEDGNESSARMAQ